MRRWKRIASESNRKSDFRLTSYNILAQQYAENHKDLYSHITQQATLRWDNRWNSLKRELDWLKSDIFCLQEVQSNHFHSSVNPFLSSRGYQMIYAKKDCNLPDGSLIAFYKESFEIITHKIVTMFDPKFCKTGQIGLVAVLRHKMTNEAIVIATTHLVFNPYRGDWKMKQALHLMAEVNNQVNNLKSYPNRNRVPVIICGDLNSSPSSPLISYFKKSEILINRLECSKISGQKPPKFNNYYKKKHSNQGSSLLTASNFYKSGIDPSTSSYSTTGSEVLLEPEVEVESESDTEFEITDSYQDENDNYEFKISKQIDLCSAYCGNEGPTTVVADGDEAVMECLDYIFYSKNNLNLISRLQLPVEYQYLPNKNNGSDHLSLSADFAFYQS